MATARAAGGMRPLQVVLVCAFDVSTWPDSRHRVDQDIFTYLMGKLTNSGRLGFVNFWSASNTYTFGMQVIEHDTNWDNNGTAAWTEEAAPWGLPKAHELISQGGGPDLNGIILLLSDGKICPGGGFFDGGEDYKSSVPVHTFTLVGDAPNHRALRAMAENSPGGMFHSDPVPEFLSEPFKQLLDSILSAAMNKPAPSLNQGDIASDETEQASEEEALGAIVEAMSPGADNQEASVKVTTTVKIERQPVKVTITAIRAAPASDELEVLVCVEAARVVEKRAPIDLVAVLDVSGSMNRSPDRDTDEPSLRAGEKSRLDHLKTAMTFVVEKLANGDRLAIVPFSQHVHNPDGIQLQSIAGEKDLDKARQSVTQLKASGQTGFMPALKKAVDVLESRAEDDKKRRRGFIVFLSDGVDMPKHSGNINWADVCSDKNHELRSTLLGKYQIDTFGFSKFHDPTSLVAIAEASYGTYSFLVQGFDKMKEAFAFSLGGINSVVAVDIAINFRASQGVQIMGVESGGYKQLGNSDDGVSASIEIPVLYAGETKHFVIHLRMPPRGGKPPQVLLSADGRFGHATDAQVSGSIDEYELHSDAIDDEVNKVASIKAEVARFKLLGVLEKLRKEMVLGNKCNCGELAKRLHKDWSHEKESCTSLTGEGDITKRFDDSVQEMVESLKTEGLSGSARLAYVWSWVSSHRMERPSTTGSPGKVAGDCYKTPDIHSMVESAQNNNDDKKQDVVEAIKVDIAAQAQLDHSEKNSTTVAVHHESPPPPSPEAAAIPLLGADNHDTTTTVQEEEVELVKILCKDGDRFVSIRGDEVVIAHVDLDDETLQWFKDYSRTGNVTDGNGQRAFALVNKATRQAMVNKEIRRPGDGLVQVQLAPYDNNDGPVDISMLWTELKEEHGDGFHQIGAMRDVSKVLDGLKREQGIAVVGVFPTHYSLQQSVSDNQLWKIIPISTTATGSPGNQVSQQTSSEITEAAEEAQKPLPNDDSTTQPDHPETNTLLLPMNDDAGSLQTPPQQECTDLCRNCCDFYARIDQRLDAWSQVKLLLQAPSQGNRLTAVFWEASLDAINQAMHRDIYQLAVVQASSLRRCYCIEKLRPAEQQHGVQASSLRRCYCTEKLRPAVQQHGVAAAAPLAPTKPSSPSE